MQENAIKTVTEAQADTATRDIYQDIKSTMGVGLVNLVWRHLAVVPSVLDWSWQLLKPHYASGAIPATAWILRESVEIPALDPISTSEQTLIAGECDPSELEAVLRTYERGNAQNLVAMCYLRDCLNPSTIKSQYSPAPLLLNATQRDAEKADRIDRAIPPLPDWDNIDNRSQACIVNMTKVWVPEQHHGLTPSVFRHLAHWPGVLEFYEKRLTRFHSSHTDTIATCSEQVIEQASLQAAKLLSQSHTTGPEPSIAAAPLQQADQLWLHNALELFINGMIAPGVVIVPAMRALLKPE